MYTSFPYLFNFLGTQEFVLVILAILLLFGPHKIPELARGFGKMMRKVKDAREGVMSEIRKGGLDIDDTKETFHKQIKSAQDEVSDIKQKVEEEFKRVNNTISREK